MGKLERGQVLADKYEIELLLGEGGMGTVYRARHLVLGEPVAIKLLSDALAGREDLVERFFREAKAAVRIKSEHVARVMDVGRDAAGRPYLVMELLEGEDLESLLARRGALPVSEACTYLLHACDAIAEAHEIGIVHRDLKPANLFLTRRKNGLARIKVLDFGISKDVAERASFTRTAAIMGSPAYMSPEQLRSTRDVDGRTDVWSLGVVLFELLTGRTPFEGDSIADLSANILRSDPSPLVRADVPPLLVELVERCLSKDPTLRPGSARELAVELERFAAPETKRAVELARTLDPTSSREVVALSPTSVVPLPAPTPAHMGPTKFSGGGLRAASSATDATVEIDSRPRRVSTRWHLWGALVPAAALLGWAALSWIGGTGSGASSAPRSAAAAAATSDPVEAPLASALAVAPAATLASPRSASASAVSSASSEKAPNRVATRASPSASSAPSVLSSTSSAPPVSEFGGRK